VKLKKLLGSNKHRDRTHNARFTAGKPFGVW